ncbi:UbiB [Desulforapulum autotrophicum HRM2]|uniref:UbiB n=1 Tax=Desulforapulum autotrophicum (strain ATCC 43914 / DSM 3382 / VKM B-1955 / HRM2) TaxID=177437 RepID=C0Q9R3_DESAH|nr:AarF/ABC1/UbiB kinase family protein [Desulforapulum autotrophicum]ACN14627.1 UbiB [Desulforapulum autotrophicum HRM2]
MKLLKLGLNLRLLRRFFTIMGVLVWFGIKDMASRLVRPFQHLFKPSDKVRQVVETEFPSPGMIRLAMERLGPSFIKLGQLLSTRDDLLPPEYVSEFKKLQDQIPPLPLETIARVLERELDRPLDQIFKTFTPEAIAAASVAQVHEAWLFSGERVAVKVIRPDIAPIIRKDIRLMYYMAEKLEKWLETGRILGAVNLVKEFERTIFNELDMFIEAGNIEKFAGNFKNTPTIHICRVYRKFTTRSVLVMEFIDGFKVDQVAAIKAHGIDPKKIARIGLQSFSRQLMEFGFFHADPHPGNTIVMFDGRVSIIDFGLVSYLDDEMVEHLANLCLGFADRDFDLVVKALQEMGFHGKRGVNIKEFRSDIKDISEPFYGRALTTISVREVYDKVMALVRKHRITIPRKVLLILKTFVQNEAIGKKLGSNTSILKIARPYAEKVFQERISPERLFKDFGNEAKIAAGYLQSMPKSLNKILETASGGDFAIKVRHTAESKLHQTLEKGLNRMIVGIIVAASTIAASLVLNSSLTVMEVNLPVFGLSGIPLTALLGVTGYVISTFLGLWLILSILRSGRL